MSPPSGSPATQTTTQSLPSAIWMPTYANSRLPNCYQGTPLEMVGEMAGEMGPQLGVHDSIDLATRFLHDQRGISIKLPAEAPEEKRAQIFIHALLTTKVAVPMAKA